VVCAHWVAVWLWLVSTQNATQPIWVCQTNWTVTLLLPASAL
jgi:hypothetical protein